MIPGVAAFGQYAHWNGKKMSDFQQMVLGQETAWIKYLAGDKK
jgi:hypothetical protein